MKLIAFLKRAKVILKWGGVIMAILKAFEVLFKELEELEPNEK